MGRNGVSPEKTARRREALAAIARGLKEEYAVAQPLSARLAELVRRIEQAASEIASKALHGRCD